MAIGPRHRQILDVNPAIRLADTVANFLSADDLSADDYASILAVFRALGSPEVARLSFAVEGIDDARLTVVPGNKYGVVWSFDDERGVVNVLAILPKSDIRSAIVDPRLAASE